MATTAFMTQFRNEFIAGFEQNQSIVRESTTFEATISGNQAVFLVADSGNASAVTRGVNGLIPKRTDNLTQNTATLQEWHDIPTRTRFNIFASQGDQRRIMYKTAQAVINRKVDEDIITELNTATNDTGAATTASLNLAIRAKTILGNNKVPHDGNICALVTPAFIGYLMQVKEFANAEYVSPRPVQDGSPFWSDRPGYHVWLGIKWMEHPELPGAGTAAEKCFMYHKSAIGHAADTSGMQMVPGYDDEQDYSFCRASVFMGSKLLQNSGVVVINHDGSAISAVF